MVPISSDWDHAVRLLKLFGEDVDFDDLDPVELLDYPPR